MSCVSDPFPPSALASFMKGLVEDFDDVSLVDDGARAPAECLVSAVRMLQDEDENDDNERWSFQGMPCQSPFMPTRKASETGIRIPQRHMSPCGPMELGSPCSQTSKKQFSFLKSSNKLRDIDTFSSPDPVNPESRPKKFAVSQEQQRALRSGALRYHYKDMDIAVSDPSLSRSDKTAKILNDALLWLED